MKFLLLVGLALAPIAQPTGALNPDVTQATIAATICTHGWTKTVRPPVAYTNALKRKQLPAGASMKDYQEDHLIPLELGGAPSDVRNLWPVPWTTVRAKDQEGHRLKRLVCKGEMSLPEAQKSILVFVKEKL